MGGRLEEDWDLGDTEGEQPLGTYGRKANVYTKPHINEVRLKGSLTLSLKNVFVDVFHHSFTRT